MARSTSAPAMPITITRPRNSGEEVREQKREQKHVVERKRTFDHVDRRPLARRAAAQRDRRRDDEGEQQPADAPEDRLPTPGHPARREQTQLDPEANEDGGSRGGSQSDVHNSARHVELTGNRDEVRDELEGKCPGTDQGDQDQFPALRYTSVACESADEDDAVGDECRERPGLDTATHENESDHERGVHNRQLYDPAQERIPPRHGGTYATDVLRAIMAQSMLMSAMTPPTTRTYTNNPRTVTA
jgi:hypothetical protein